MSTTFDIDKLSVVNDCLATRGESGLVTLEDDHSLKDDALRILNTVSNDVQKKPRWFNCEFIELLPDAVSKYVYIPNDVIRVLSYNSRDEIVQRGRRLYNKVRNTYEFDGSLCVEVVRVLPFEDLPYHASSAIRDQVVMRFQHAYDGDQQRYRQLTEIAGMSWAELEAEDMRQRKPNLLNRSMQRMVSGIHPGIPGFYEPPRY